MGSLALNDTVYADGRTSMADAGGNALYAAIGARLWPGEVRAVAVVGEDWPEAHTGRLAEAGIDVSGVLRRAGETLRAWTIYEADGTRRYLSRNAEVTPLTPNPYRSAPLTEAEARSWTDAAARVHRSCSPRPEGHEAALAAAAVLHLAPMPIEHLRAWLTAARDQPGLEVCLDVPPFPPGTRLDDPVLAELLRGADAFLPSEVEARSIAASLSPEAFCRAIAERGPRLVVVKLGERGLVLFDRERNRLEAVPAVPAAVVDLTGAGDAFCGGWAAARAAGLEPLEAARRGTRSAARVIEGFGGLHALAGPPLAAEASPGEDAS